MKRVLLNSLLVLFTLPCLASPIDNLIAQYVATAHVGLFIQDANTKEILYTHNSDQGLVPASLTKSFATAAGLLDLDSDFSYQTTLGYNHDDLVLIFSGDPSLTTLDLEKLLLSLSAQNVKTINGNIIIDNTFFPKPYDGRGWVAEDSNWYFGTPVKTIMIDENQIPIVISPSKTLGQKAQVKLLSNDVNIPITHEVTTVSEEEANTLCQLNVELNPENNGIYLYGCWPALENATTLKVALANPERLIKQIILKSLDAQHITLNGQIIIGKGTITDILATHQSGHLAELNAVIMKKSNNLYADSLTKILGKKHYNRGTLQAGSYSFLQILEKKLGLHLDSIRLFDGSGGSTYNQVTAQSVGLLYQAMYDQKEHKNAFLTMQLVDEDHTFYNRIPENTPTPLYIKTGSMTGVSNIAGYIKTKSGRTLIIVSLLNSLPKDKTNTRAFERDLMRYLISQ